MRRSQRATPYLLVGVGALYLLVFTGVPLFRGFQLSLTDTKLLNPARGNYIGIENYASLASDPRFLGSVVTTVIYTVSCVALAVLLGTITAFVINHAFVGRTVARAILIFPWAVPTVAVALVFRWIYNDSSGIANKITGALGWGEPGWLTDPQFGMLAVVIPSVWKIAPFVMLVVLAALQTAPQELYEAARVDGASDWQGFRAVTLPHISPSLKIVGLLMAIWSFRRFEVIWLLTGGGPADATNTIVISVYRQAFANSELGFASAIGMVGLLLSVIVTVAYFVVERRNEVKEARS